MKKLIDPIKNTFDKPKLTFSSLFSKKVEAPQNGLRDFKKDFSQLHDDPPEESNVKKREILDNILGSNADANKQFFNNYKAEQPKNETHISYSRNDASKATPFFGNLEEKNNNPLLKNQNIKTPAFEPPTKKTSVNHAPNPSNNLYYFLDTPSKKQMDSYRNQQNANFNPSEKNKGFSNNSSSAFKKYDVSENANKNVIASKKSSKEKDISSQVIRIKKKKREEKQSKEESSDNESNKPEIYKKIKKETKKNEFAKKKSKKEEISDSSSDESLDSKNCPVITKKIFIEKTAEKPQKIIDQKKEKVESNPVSKTVKTKQPSKGSSLEKEDEELQKRKKIKTNETNQNTSNPYSILQPQKVEVPKQIEVTKNEPKEEKTANNLLLSGGKNNSEKQPNEINFFSKNTESPDPVYKENKNEPTISEKNNSNKKGENTNSISLFNNSNSENKSFLFEPPKQNLFNFSNTKTENPLLEIPKQKQDFLSASFQKKETNINPKQSDLEKINDPEIEKIESKPAENSKSLFASSNNLGMENSTQSTLFAGLKAANIASNHIPLFGQNNSKESHDKQEAKDSKPLDLNTQNTNSIFLNSNNNNGGGLFNGGILFGSKPMETDKFASSPFGKPAENNSNKSNGNPLFGGITGFSAPEKTNDGNPGLFNSSKGGFFANLGSASSGGLFASINQKENK